MQGEEQFSVGELARLVGTTVRTVRYYEQVGLLAPATRSGGGHRRYGADQRARLLRILTLRELGVAVDRICQRRVNLDPVASGES